MNMCNSFGSSTSRVAVILWLFVLFAPATAFAIDSPQNTRGSKDDATTIKWEWNAVGGAAQYEVLVNDVNVGLTQDTHFYSRGLSNGLYSMSVKALTSDWQFSSSSLDAVINLDASSPVQADDPAPSSGASGGTSGVFGPPGNVRGTQIGDNRVRWEWDWVSGAVRYDVVVDNASVGVVTDTRLTSSWLADGVHSVVVKSMDANWNYSGKSAKAFVTVGGDSNSSVSAPPPPSSSSQSNIDAPRDVRGTEVRTAEIKWEWAAVSDASQYEVTVDGNSAGTTGNLYLYTPGLSAGEHSMSVRAVDGNGGRSAQSEAVRKTVNVGASNNSSSNTSNEHVQTSAPVNTPQNDNGLVDPVSWSIPEATQKAGYQLAFSDEFNEGSLNRARWNTQLRWDGSFNGDRYEYRTVNGEDQFYVNIFSEDRGHQDTVVPKHNPFEFNGSRLAIRTKRNPLKLWDGSQGYGPLFDMVSQQDFLSGAISSHGKFSQKYGYFEARIKIPRHEGTFPAFWLHHQRREWEGTQKTEIDIMENLGHKPVYVYNSFHYFKGVSEGVSGTAHFVKPQPNGQIYTGTDFSQDYHVYAVEWEPGYAKFLIDGEKVSEVWNDNLNHEELYIIINLAIGGNWTNFPSNAGGNGRSHDNHFPNQNDINNWSNPALEIDYVRAYKRK